MAKKVIKDLLKKAMSSGDKSSASQSYQSMAAKKAKPNTAKIDSTKKVTIGGNAKPSVIIKKQTTVKPAKPVEKLMPYKPITKEFRKKMQDWDKLPKVEYKPFPKK